MSKVEEARRASREEQIKKLGETYRLPNVSRDLKMNLWTVAGNIAIQLANDSSYKEDYPDKIMRRLFS